ncbi:MAG: hypothetical protein U0931_26800 [Vulcanimicrobiota bacterium]
MPILTAPLEQAVQALLADTGSVDDLVAALDGLRAQVEQTREDFWATATREGPAAMAMLAPEMGAVENSLADYARVLDSIAGYLQEFDKLYLGNAESLLQAAQARLNLDFLRFREAALSQRGPTTHPGLNHLHTLASLLLMEPTPELQQQFEQQRLMEEARCQAGPASLELDDSLAPLGPLLLAFGEDYLALLQSEQPWGEWLTGLTSLGQRFSRLDVNFLSRRYAAGPTPVNPLNLVINSAWLLGQQAVEPELVQVFLIQAGNSLQDILEAHQQMLLGLSEDDPHRQDGNTLTTAVESLLDCLDQYWAWLDSPQPEALQGLYETAAGLATQVHELFGKIQAEQTSQVSSCPICGLHQSEGASRCRQCGAALPGGQAFAALEGESAGAAGSSRFQRLLSTAEQVLEGQEDPDLLVQLIEEMEAALDLARKSQQPAGEDPLGQAAANYAEGLQAVAKALEVLRAFSEEPDREGLDSAGEQLDLASRKLQTTQQELAQLKGTP